MESVNENSYKTKIKGKNKNSSRQLGLNMSFNCFFCQNSANISNKQAYVRFRQGSSSN